MANETKLGKEIYGFNLQDDREYKIKRYDFKRPDKFAKEQIRTLQILGETFCRLAATTLSATLRSPVKVHVASVDQLTYQEFIRSILNPTTMAVVQMDPLKGAAVLEIDPPITFSIIDRIFGGQGQYNAMKRDLSEIEASIMEVVVVRLLGNLRESWAAVIDLRPRLGQIEVNPQFAQIVAPQEMVVLTTIEMKAGDAEGFMNFCIPYITIEPIMSKLNAQYMYSSIRRKRNLREVPVEILNDLETDAEICVSAEPVSLKTLGSLKKGDRISLPEWTDGKAFIRSGGAPVLNLKREGNPADQDIAFSVDIPILKGFEYLEQAEPSPDINLLKIDEPLAKLSGVINRGFESLQKKISEMSSWQESIADQMEYGGVEKEIPLAGKVRQRPFDIINRDNADHLCAFISEEHPQLIAMILSYLSPDLASTVISKLPEELRPDIIKRIGAMDRISPEVAREVERVLEKKLRAMPLEDVMRAGGIETAVSILNYVSRGVEKLVIESLEHDDPDYAEEIKKRMFVFEDIVLLDPGTIPMIYKTAGPQVFAVAMKGTPAEVSEHIFKSLGKEEQAELQAEVENTKPMRLSEVELVQQKIVEIIRAFEDQGEITVARQDETLV